MSAEGATLFNSTIHKVVEFIGVQCRTFGAHYSNFFGTPASRLGLLTAGPSGLGHDLDRGFVEF
jgi:hypothetical protein